jgi:hypothetical protein
MTVTASAVQNPAYRPALFFTTVVSFLVVVTLYFSFEFHRLDNLLNKLIRFSSCLSIRAKSLLRKKEFAGYQVIFVDSFPDVSV